MERSIFQNDFYKNSMPDSDSSQKSVQRNCFPFFKIRTGSGSNMQKTLKSEGKFHLPSFLGVSRKFDRLPVRIKKK